MLIKGLKKTTTTFSKFKSHNLFWSLVHTRKQRLRTSVVHQTEKNQISSKEKELIKLTVCDEQPVYNFVIFRTKTVCANSSTKMFFFNSCKVLRKQFQKSIGKKHFLVCTRKDLRHFKSQVRTAKQDLLWPCDTSFAIDQNGIILS